MASHPTGSDPLLRIRSDRIELTVKAKTPRQPLDKDEGACSVIRLECVNPRHIEILGKEPLTPDPEDRGLAVLAPEVTPLFFEQADYLVSLRSLNGEAIAFRSDNPLIDAMLGYPYDNDPTHMDGVINYGNNVGFSDWNITADGVSVLRLRLEVYPTKISYKEDYRAMMDDINDTVSECVLDFMKKTYQEFVPNHTKNNIPAVFFSILKTVYGKYRQAVNRVTAVPHHKLETVHEIVPVYKAKRTDQQTVKWLRSRPELISVSNGTLTAERVLAARKRITYDTAENQLVKYMLQSTVRRIESFAKRYQTGSQDIETRKAVIAEAGRMAAELRRILSTTFLDEVSDYKATKSMSLVFGMAPGYRELYRYWLMLQNGLSVGGDVFRMSVKETAQLYEYWCFIKLYSILKSRYELKSPDILKVDRSGVTVDLRKGRESAVEFRNPLTEEVITLSYNPSESKTQTVNQRPDNVLSLEKKGSKRPYKYVFDAKYRIESNPDSAFYPDTRPGPKVDDINTMHRYRDAIVYENPESRFVFQKSMFGAYILFPYADEEAYAGRAPGTDGETRQHRFYSSIDSVNIGGLPFLPTATKLVTERLDELISDSAESAFERASLPGGIDERLEKPDWTRRDVLVGLVRDTKTLSVLLEKNFYYTRSGINRKNLPLRWVALYQPVNQFGANAGVIWVGEITETRTIRRSEITEIPATGHPDAPCYRFEIREWKKLPTKIAARDHGIMSVAYTNRYLLEHATHTDELSIRTAEEFRFYTELKRRVDEKTDVLDEEHNRFEFNGQIVVFDETNIHVTDLDGSEIRTVSLAEFRQHPNKTFRFLWQ